MRGRAAPPAVLPPAPHDASLHHRARVPYHRAARVDNTTCSDRPREQRGHKGHLAE